jgi:hypothetical protein
VLDWIPTALHKMVCLLNEEASEDRDRDGLRYREGQREIEIER